MNRAKFSAFLFLLASVLISCKETEVKTDGEKLAEQITTEINNRTISSARVYVWAGSLYLDYGQVDKPNYKISGAFLVINNTDFFNFNRLERFNFSGNTVHFYFTK